MKIEIIAVNGRAYIKAGRIVGRYFPACERLRRISRKLTGAETTLSDWNSMGVFHVEKDHHEQPLWIGLCFWVGCIPRIFYFPPLVKGDYCPCRESKRMGSGIRKGKNCVINNCKRFLNL